MMRPHLKAIFGAFCALVLTFHASYAGTIIKLNLGGVGPDLVYSGGVFGQLSTVDHTGGLSPIGDQVTDILFTDFLGSMLPIAGGSYTLSGATATVAPTNLGGGVVSQSLTGGSFQIYDNADVKLLDVNLNGSLLVGTTAGGFFSVNNGVVAGGTLASQLVSNSITMSMTLTNISGGGLQIGGSGRLEPFTADATKEITATQIPEPSAAVLLAIALVSGLALRRPA